jgi:hypothetical protein
MKKQHFFALLIALCYTFALTAQNPTNVPVIAPPPFGKDVPTFYYDNRPATSTKTNVVYVTTTDGRRITEKQYAFEQQCAAVAREEAASKVRFEAEQATIKAKKAALTYQEQTTAKLDFEQDLKAQEALELANCQAMTKAKYAYKKAAVVVSFKVKYEFTAPPTTLKCGD